MGVSPPRAPRTVRDTLASYGSRCSAIPMRDGKRLCLGHRAPPATGWLWVAAEHCSPFGPVPLQNLPPSYELLRPCAPHRYSDPCGLSRLDVSLCIGATGSHVPYKSLIRLRAAYMPDVARAVFRTAPELIPEAGRPSGFDIIFGISTRHQQFAFARLSGSYLTGLSPAQGSRRRIWLAKSCPNLRAHCRTVSWLTSMPRAASISSTMRRLSGKRKYSHTAWLMTSGGKR